MDAAVWRDVAYVQNAANRERVLTALVDAGRPMTPTELADELDVVVKTASRAVRQLHDHGLVECLNPEAPRDRRYQPTDRGRTVFSRLQAVDDHVTAPETVLAEPSLEYGDDRPSAVDDAAAYVMMSENRAAVLQQLHRADIPLTPSELADDLSIGFNSASRAVRQLTEEGLVECITPDVARFRRYTTTDRGAQVVERLAS